MTAPVEQKRPDAAARPGTLSGVADSDPQAALARSFKGAIAAIRRLRGRETQRPGELSYAQYMLLFGLYESSELSSRELACQAELSAATVTQMLDGLEAHGLVKRTRSAIDKRIVLTALTERGQQLVDERRAQYEPRWRAALSGFSPEELQTAASVLDALTELYGDFAEE
jgi:DNA-binding MarR family transcriptional regulator